MSLRQHLLSPRFYVYTTLDYWPAPVKIATCNSRKEAQTVADIERLRLVKENPGIRPEIWITTEKLTGLRSDLKVG